MAVYKVPQDVEADDKLIGPFSFRQFIYIIITVISIALAWGLAQLFIGLALIPLPIILLFGTLALPLRKDQPMEIYLAAVISFHLKPRKRLWQPDGIQSLVEITAPKVVEVHRMKDLSQTEAEQRLSYLANIVDTGGWAVRGVGAGAPDSALQNDVFYAAQQTEDVLDNSSGVAHSFEAMISQADAKHKQELVQRMHQPVAPVPVESPVTTPIQTAPQPAAPIVAPDDPHIVYNPYPVSMHQSVVTPLGEQPSAAPPPPPAPLPTNPPVTTSESVVSPGIINLANNSDLSIETIAHEARRIQEKEHQLPEDEVVISLR
jgi:hypothetical protein